MSPLQITAIQLINPNRISVTPSKLNKVAKRCLRPETKLTKKIHTDTKNRKKIPNLKVVQ
ncbi:MAG: hypothetical protein ACK518_02100 [bacterium]|jgi:hypothetical protein